MSAPERLHPSEVVAQEMTSREEAWKYTPSHEIVERISASTSPSTWLAMTVSNSVVDALAGPHFGPRLVFVNGVYEADLSDHDQLPAGLWCGLAPPQHPSTAALLTPTERLRSVDDALFSSDGTAQDIALVITDAGAQILEPVHIVYIAVPDDRHAPGSVLSRPRTIVDVGTGSHLAVVETFCGLEGPTLSDTSTVVRLAEWAQLDLCRIQMESSQATHVGSTRIDQGAGSELRMASITIGGDIARNEIGVHLNAPGTRSELTGVNLTSGHQRHDTVVSVDHAASHGVSRQRFAGVVDDHGRGSFSGEIVVRPGTVATDADQSNRNLVLNQSAEADTRPWLRILADDVQCTHGSTVGRLDDDALFYLRSRGIALADARTMLIDAFIRDITDSIAHESIRAHVAAILDQR